MAICPAPGTLRLSTSRSSSSAACVGGEQQISRSVKWGIAGELLYGGTLDVNQRSVLPPAAGGRGDLAGSYSNTASVVVSVYGNWSF